MTTIDWRSLKPHVPLGPGDAQYVERTGSGGDEIAQWITCSATPSRSSRWGAEIVAKRNRDLVDIPPGLHRIRIELASVAGESCLVRLRQAESFTDDEP